jgi:hypothetical protein
MKGWFVPPIVIPVLIAVGLVGYVSLNTFALKAIGVLMAN